MPTVVGVVGDGPSTRKNTNALLDDFHAANVVDRVLVPGIVEEFSDAARYAADWADKNTVPCTILLTPGCTVDHLDDYDLQTYGLETNFPEQAAAQDCTDLFIAWNENKDTACTAVAELALRAGKKVFDLSNGLYPITQGDDSADADVSAPDPEVAPGDTAPNLTPQGPSQPQDGGMGTDSPDEAQQVDPEVVTYAHKPEGLSDADLERILAELATRITDAVVPVVIKDVCQALSVVLANVEV